MLNLRILKYICLFLIFQGALKFQAESQVLAEPNDSIRQFILFRSHLLVQEREITPDLIDSLVNDSVPLALRMSEKASGIVEKLTGRMAPELLPLVVISDKNTGTYEDRNAMLLAMNPVDLNEDGSFFLIEALNDSASQLPLILKQWEQSGRLPNFISAVPGKIHQTATLVRAINRYPKIFGIVKNGNQPLTDVSWKDFPNRKTSGYFSFPLSSSGNPAFAPYKPGYRFSPDIILPAPENLPNLKVFNALPLESDFGLTDYFRFSGKVRNLHRKNDGEITLYGPEFVNDTERGNCAFFSGKAYLDGGMQSRSAIKPNFSITAWIKPTELGNNNCILAKGRDFVLKIHQGQLTFTVQGIKDYRSGKTMIPVNKWSFVSLVHSEAGNHIRFYLNGELTDQIQLLTQYKISDYTMLIGSNLWEEFFEGYLSEIKIWERELNDEEVRNEFRKQIDHGFELGTPWLLGILLFLGALGIALRRKLLPEKSGKSTVAKVKSLETDKSKTAQEQILCFGGLKVINAEGKDISLKFSPKIRQLFVIILLHSEGIEKGINSQKLSDCLWPGMNLQNAKNIRGTTIQNLKALLAPAGIRLKFQDKLWKFDLSEGSFSELGFVEWQLNILEKTAFPEISLSDLQELVAILKRGTLFQGLNESWLDPYLERTSNRIIESGLKLFRQIPEENYDLLLDVAEAISINDPLNEHALRKKIGILTRQGKLSLAHSVFDNFSKLYFELYREKYPDDFKALMKDQPD